MFRKLDYLYLLSCRDESIKDELVKELLNLGKKIAKYQLNKAVVYNVLYEDIEDYVLQVAVYILNNYVKSKGIFSEYASYVYNKRLTTKIVNLCETCGKKVESLDLLLEDGTPLLELIEDKKYSSIPDEISYDEFKSYMSSPAFGDNRLRRLAKKIYIKTLQGYTRKEIQEMFNLSGGQYRYLKKYIDTKLDDFKNKIDLK